MEPDPYKVKDQRSYSTGGLAGVGSTRHDEITYANGEIWESTNSANWHLIGSDNATVKEWERAIKRWESSREPPKLAQGDKRYNPDTDSYETVPGLDPSSPSATSQWSIQTTETGQKVRVNELTGEVKPLEGFGPTPTTPVSGTQWQNPTTGAVVLLDPKTGEPIKELSGPIPGWVPGRGVVAPQQAPQRAPRFPEEIELSKLQIEKAKRDLLSQYQRAQQDAWAAIQDIQGRLERGEIDPDQANELGDLIKENLDAALKGTTPYQIQKDKESAEQAKTQEKNRIAENVAARRAQVGGQLGQTLLSSSLGQYNKIYSSTNPPLDFTPLLAYTKSLAEDMAGGADMGVLAKAVLQGALGGGQ